MNRFTNLDGSERREMKKMIKGLRKTAQAKIKNQGVPAPSITPDINLLRQRVETGRGMRITWLGHSGWLIQTSGLSFLIDPVLGKRINVFLNRRSMFNAHLHHLHPFAAALITHDHYDHLQVKLLKHLKTKIIVGAGTKEFLREKGLEAEELNWWEAVKIGEVKITFVPAKHGSQRGLLDINSRLWGGFVLEAPGVCLYHAGDTAYFKIFQDIKERFKKINLAMLPIGGYSVIDADTSHMTPEQAVKAFVDLAADLMMPMHWGTFQTSKEPLDEPPRRLIKEWQRLRLDNRKLKIMAVGESFMYAK